MRSGSRCFNPACPSGPRAHVPGRRGLWQTPRPSRLFQDPRTHRPPRSTTIHGARSATSPFEVVDSLASSILPQGARPEPEPGRRRVPIHTSRCGFVHIPPPPSSALGEADSGSPPSRSRKSHRSGAVPSPAPIQAPSAQSCGRPDHPLVEQTNARETFPTGLGFPELNPLADPGTCRSTICSEPLSVAGAGVPVRRSSPRLVAMPGTGTPGPMGSRFPTNVPGLDRPARRRPRCFVHSDRIAKGS